MFFSVYSWDVTCKDWEKTYVLLEIWRPGQWLRMILVEKSLLRTTIFWSTSLSTFLERIWADFGTQSGAEIRSEAIPRTNVDQVQKTWNVLTGTVFFGYHIIGSLIQASPGTTNCCCCITCKKLWKHLHNKSASFSYNILLPEMILVSSLINQSFVYFYGYMYSMCSFEIFFSRKRFVLIMYDFLFFLYVLLWSCEPEPSFLCPHGW